MTVFYADPDPEEIELFCYALQSFDNSIKCITASNGVEALGILDVCEKPSLIFLEIDMPILNGQGVFNKLKENMRLKDIPVIFYSSNNNEEIIQQIMNMGAFQFLPKAYSVKELTQSLKSIFSKAISSQ